MLKNKKVIKPMLLACSAGLMLTACATYEDDTAYSETSMESTSSISEGSGAEQGWQSGARSDYSSQQQGSRQQYSSQSGQSSQLQSGNDLIIPLHEEQVNVGKRTVDAGTVTIRKVVTTETVSQPVQLRKETLIIDREGAGSSGAQFQSSASTQSSQRSATTASTAQTQDADADIDADADVSASADATGVHAQAEFDQAEPAGAQQRSSSTQTQSVQTQRSQQGQSFSSNADGNAFQEQTYTIQLREEQPVVEKSVVQTGQVTARKNAQTQRQTVQREVRREDVRIDQGANARNVEIRGNFDSARGSINEPSGAARPAASSSVERSSSSYKSETEIDSDVDVDVDADAGRIGVEGDAQFEDSKTLDDINQGSNTRGGAEDLQRFDEKANP